MHPRRAKRTGSAFTLIELMVVLTLIGILSAMIIPEMRGSCQETLLKSASRELMDVFGLAYSRAVSQGQTLRVRLDTVKGRYTVERQSGERGAGNGFVPLRDLAGGQGTIDDRIAISLKRPVGDQSGANAPADELASRPEAKAEPPPDGITFYADGTADAAEVVLRDRSGFRLGLRVDPITARVEVVELERE